MAAAPCLFASIQDPFQSTFHREVREIILKCQLVLSVSSLNISIVPSGTEYMLTNMAQETFYDCVPDYSYFFIILAHLSSTYFASGALSHVIITTAP